MWTTLIELGRIYREDLMDDAMYELMFDRKWVWWEWRVCDPAGKVLVSGREVSRPEARYQAARALFHLLLTTTGPWAMEELKRRRGR